MKMIQSKYATEEKTKTQTTLELNLAIVAKLIGRRKVEQLTMKSMLIPKSSFSLDFFPTLNEIYEQSRQKLQLFMFVD